MIIKYPDGRMVEGFLLSRDENVMRVALEDRQDAAEFIDVQGSWVSENLEPVKIVFEWQLRPHAAEVMTDADFICSKDLAAHLVRLLVTDSEEEEDKPRLQYLSAGSTIM